MLKNETDDLQQYQGWYCIVIDRLRTSLSETTNQVTEKAEKVLTENLQFNPEEVNYQIDKCHRIGPINTKDGMQSTTVWFKTHSYREAVYLKKENATKNKKSNFSSHEEEKLTYAYNNADKLPEIDFFYADIHSNLKFCLKNLMKKKSLTLKV